MTNITNDLPYFQWTHSLHTVYEVWDTNMNTEIPIYNKTSTVYNIKPAKHKHQHKIFNVYKIKTKSFLEKY